MAASGRLVQWQKRLRQGLRYAVLATIAGLVGVVGYAFYLQISVVLNLNSDYHALQADIQAMQQKNEALTQELQLKDDPEYLEYLARKMLGLVRPGETKIILPPDMP